MLLSRGRRRRGRLLGMMGSKGGEKGEKSQDRWYSLLWERGPGQDRVTQRWSQDPRERFVSISCRWKWYRIAGVCTSTNLA
jgi:hypothetical protein